ncbi:hypothetical protein G6F40_016244 [Rhizopus arrhizus]|nr:hypothetical protein G6F40_016244 [Rhizopus arrhizus]
MAPNRASPASVVMKALGNTMNNLARVTPKRLRASGCASCPVQMAAVMAATLNAWAPNGAMISEPRPVTVRMGFALVLNPSLRSTSMPGMYWPGRVMMNRGSATPSSACTE